MRPVVVILLVAASGLVGCDQPRPQVGRSASTTPPAKQTSFKASTDPFSHAVLRRLHGAQGPEHAAEMIRDFGIPCTRVSRFSFWKTVPFGEAFKVQCDETAWFVLLESADGPVKVMRWAGSGEPF